MMFLLNLNSDIWNINPQHVRYKLPLEQSKLQTLEDHLQLERALQQARRSKKGLGNPQQTENQNTQVDDPNLAANQLAQQRHAGSDGAPSSGGAAGNTANMSPTVVDPNQTAQKLNQAKAGDKKKKDGDQQGESGENASETGKDGEGNEEKKLSLRQRTQKRIADEKEKLKDKAKEKTKSMAKDFAEYIGLPLLLSLCPGATSLYAFYKLLQKFLGRVKEGKNKLNQYKQTLKQIRLFILLFNIINDFVIYLAGLGLIVMIVDWMSKSWWGKAQTLLKLGWGAIKILVDLF